MIGEELSKLGVYYLYNKALPIYEFRDPGNLTSSLDFFMQREYYLNNWVSENGIATDDYAKQADQLCDTITSSNYLYQFGISTLSE